MDCSNQQASEPRNRLDSTAGAIWRESPAFQRFPSITPTCELPMAKCLGKGQPQPFPSRHHYPPPPLYIPKKPWETIFPTTQMDRLVSRQLEELTESRGGGQHLWCVYSSGPEMTQCISSHQHYRVVERVSETKSKLPTGLLTCCVTLKTSLNLSEPCFPPSVNSSMQQTYIEVPLCATRLR